MLGLNVPFIQDGRLILRNLGMREIYVSHTGQNLKDIVMEILASYGIARDQILSVTTDIGSNMLTAIASMKKTPMEMKMNLIIMKMRKKSFPKMKILKKCYKMKNSSKN